MRRSQQLPFSNEAQQGFENRIAELVAWELGARLEYEWWPQRRGFVRNTFRAGICDLIIGVPSSFELAATTRPYYRSTYVFVTRSGDPIPTSFDDPLLTRVTIGAHLIWWASSRRAWRAARTGGGCMSLPKPATRFR